MRLSGSSALRALRPFDDHRARPAPPPRSRARGLPPPRRGDRNRSAPPPAAASRRSGCSEKVGLGTSAGLAQRARDQGAGECGLAGAEIAAQRDRRRRRRSLSASSSASRTTPASSRSPRPFGAHARPGPRGPARAGARPLSGKRTVTRVPRPGSDSSAMAPPCSSTRLLTIESPRPGAAVLGALAAALEALEHALLLVLGDADALVLDGERHHAALAPHADADGVAGLGEADGVGEEIVEHLPDPRLVGDEFHGILGNADVEIEARALGAVAHAEHGGVDDARHARPAPASAPARRHRWWRGRGCR